MTEYFLFIAGFFILITGAKYLVDGASAAGVKLGLSQMVIGLTIVAIGTSLPELMINVFASISGNTDLAIGNVVGSNLMNTLLIIGITAAIYPIHAVKSVYKRDVWLNLLAIATLIMLANDRLIFKGPNIIDQLDGAILLVLFVYVLYLIFSKSNSDQNTHKISQATMSWVRTILFVVGGTAGLYFGGKWIVDSTTVIGARLGISDSMMGLTVIAIATSLPELATSIVAAMNKKTDIALGNALGSNIFNIFLVLGLSSVIQPIPFDISLNVQLILLLASGFFITILIYVGKTSKTITRIEGSILIFLYLAFMVWMIQSQ
ncbi:MAG: sodium:proton exchanger [Bacteroidetes bacterium CG18_big_fil_WC_8_21_14_2_50_41_14]|nr:MAG: sodium:proton exchanger [Bacteroidetes bacterium CG18_big_fil_WC_8_21_14_2_50_41_14]PJB59827.1 MAG: sodium:proton exchanger [Bacteroidetes bacterium CG_4_9_14_3_um_filter_41_19]